MDIVKCLKSCILSECHHMVIAVVGEREFKSKSSLWEKCFLFYFVLGFFFLSRDICKHFIAE